MNKINLNYKLFFSDYKEIWTIYNYSVFKDIISKEYHRYIAWDKYYRFKRQIKILDENIKDKME